MNLSSLNSLEILLLLLVELNRFNTFSSEASILLEKQRLREVLYIRLSSLCPPTTRGKYGSSPVSTHLDNQNFEQLYFCITFKKEL